MVFIDRLLATLVHLRHGATHYVLACWFGVDRSTITGRSARCGRRSLSEAAPSPPASGYHTASPRRPAGLVRVDLRTPAQGPLLTPSPRRARHRTPQELAITRPLCGEMWVPPATRT
ncbi:transposase family protein [Streptomyces sp. NPDC056549]|uniref:helix-turn-helix domain-containing protein n=1 Tax=Streptomyces sp. NPDC056549 TaxID=3345864 RepID=UPI0036B18B39